MEKKVNANYNSQADIVFYNNPVLLQPGLNKPIWIRYLGLVFMIDQSMTIVYQPDWCKCNDRN